MTPATVLIFINLVNRWCVVWGEHLELEQLIDDSNRPFFKVRLKPPLPPLEPRPVARLKNLQRVVLPQFRHLPARVFRSTRFEIRAFRRRKWGCARPHLSYTTIRFYRTTDKMHSAVFRVRALSPTEWLLNERRWSRWTDNVTSDNRYFYFSCSSRAGRIGWRETPCRQWVSPSRYIDWNPFATDDEKTTAKHRRTRHNIQVRLRVCEHFRIIF